MFVYPRQWIILAHELSRPQHFLNTTVVTAESAIEKTFHVFGMMQKAITADGRCSTTYELVLKSSR